MQTAAPQIPDGYVVAAATALAPGDAGGTWVKLMPSGRFTLRDGRGPFDAGDAARLRGVVEASLRRAGATELMVDYDHQSAFGAVPGVGGRAPAAGWIKRLEVREGAEAGIWGRVEWTEAAAAAIRAGEYRYLSPLFHAPGKPGRVQLLISAALTNTPALDLAAVAARAQTRTGDSMSNLAKALGLAEDASEDQILAAVTTILAGQAKAASALGLKETASADELVAAATAARAAGTASPDPAKFVPVEQVTAMQAELAELKKTVTEDKAKAAVAAAIESGRLAPALRDWGLELYAASAQQFEAFIAKAPVLTGTQLGEKARKSAEAGADDPSAIAARATAYQRQVVAAGQEIDYAAAVVAVQAGKDKEARP